MNRHLIAVIFTVLALSGCGVFFGSGDDPFGDGDTGTGYDPETPVTTGNFSITYHRGSTVTFAEGLEKVASAVYDGTKTTVRMRATLRTDDFYAYNVVITYPGERTGTFQVGQDYVSGLIISFDGTTDAGMWSGTRITSPDVCTTDDYDILNTGFISITGQGDIGQRVVGTYDLSVAEALSCGSMRRFQGDFSVVRGS